MKDKKNIVIALLVIVVIALGGYLIYDKVNNKSNCDTNNKQEEKANNTNVDKNSDIYWLNDGTLKIHDNSIVDECEFNNGKSVISLTFDDYQTIKAIMVYNSNDFYKTFKEIDNIRLYIKKDGVETVSDTGVIPFNYHEYSLIDQDYKTVFAGASSTIEFNDLEVNKIEITVSKSYGESILGISEIQVLGKENA